MAEESVAIPKCIIEFSFEEIHILSAMNLFAQCCFIEKALAQSKPYNYFQMISTLQTLQKHQNEFADLTDRIGSLSVQYARDIEKFSQDTPAVLQ